MNQQKMNFHSDNNQQQDCDDDNNASDLHTPDTTQEPFEEVNGDNNILMNTAKLEGKSMSIGIFALWMPIKTKKHDSMNNLTLVVVLKSTLMCHHHQNIVIGLQIRPSSSTS